MPAGEISIQTRTHPNPRGQWITFPIVIRGISTLDVVLDTGSPASAVSPEVARQLLAEGLLEKGNPPYPYRLTALTTEAQALPDLEVMVLPRLTANAIEGLVGLNCLVRFSYVHFDVPTFTLTLGPLLRRSEGGA